MTTDADVIRSLDLSANQLGDISSALVARIRSGLCENGGEIAALPSHYSPPVGVRGLAGVIDVGGTNARAAVVEFTGRSATIVAGPVERPLAPVVTASGDRRALFYSLQAELLTELAVPRGLPFGYCFSYPARSLPNRDMVLLRWTKGINIPGMIGSPVGAGLRAVLAAVGLAPKCVAVVNDTVASLLGGAMFRDVGTALRSVGLIVGTGTNMACYFSPEQVSKLPLKSAMAFNLETGNFDPPHLTPVDLQLDAASVDPGKQRFEKAVSGAYLPQLLALLGCGGDRKVTDSSALVALRDAAPESRDGKLAAALLGRSADLVAAALAAVMSLLPADGEVQIFAEGGLVWGDPRYADRVASSLRHQLDANRGFSIRRRDDINLVGAACAALAV